MADVGLLPLPEGEAIGWTRAWSYDQMRSYARANVSRATARLQAEIEALRAEVAAWRELSDHVRVGACAAIWPDRYTDARIRDVAAALKRAARMAEALEEIRSRSSIDLAMRSDQFELIALLGDIHQIAAAVKSRLELAEQRQNRDAQ